jgi:hypothetical protein
VVVQPSVSGSGALSFDSVSASDANLNPLTVTSGPDLPFSVEAATAVPEPQALVMAVIALAIMPTRVVLARLLSRQR